jgi:hypothetical protein
MLTDLGPAVAKHYWREFSYFGLGPAFPGAVEAAWALLDVGRAAAALDLILLYSAEDSGLEEAEVVAAGLEALLANGFEDADFRRLDSYQFEQLFGVLARHRDEIGTQRVVNLEWQLFPTLGFEANAPTLHQALVEEPTFFAELVTAQFRPDSSTEDEPEDAADLEQRRARATRAYEVLSSLRRCPGVSDSGALNGAQLREWVQQARAELERVDRLSVGDGQIGELLAFAPPAEDGSMVHEVVRDLLEEIRSDAMDRGLARGIYNKRRVTSRDLLQGGAEEWELAKSFRAQADAVRDSPRTRKLLLGLADSYEAQARHEDERAERRHQGLGW